MVHSYFVYFQINSEQFHIDLEYQMEKREEMENIKEDKGVKVKSSKDRMVSYCEFVCIYLYAYVSGKVSS